MMPLPIFEKPKMHYENKIPIIIHQGVVAMGSHWQPLCPSVFPYDPLVLRLMHINGSSTSKYASNFQFPIATY